MRLSFLVSALVFLISSFRMASASQDAQGMSALPKNFKENLSE